ncbi:MAG: hypothetical protein OWQ48_06590 [Desulfurococcus sp.]|nr:hypothetical protein [Desulfurococcus sp.]
MVIVVALTVIIVRIVVSRLLNELVLRGSISVNIREVTLKILDIAVIIILVGTATIIFIPQYWGILAVLGLLGLTILLLLIYPVSSYIAIVALQMRFQLKGRFYEILLPGSSKSLHGRIVDSTIYHSIVEDEHGVIHYVPNAQLARSVLKPYTPRVVFEVAVRLPGGGSLDLVELEEAIAGKLEEYGYPGFKDVKDVSVVRASGSELVFRVVFYPISIPVRKDSLRRLVVDLRSTLLKELQDRVVDVHVAVL